MTRPRDVAEADRLAALASYAVLDTAPEPEFDDLTRLAALICRTPTALITLVDERRQWFKSRVAFPTSETPREVAFCAYTVDHRKPFVVPDTAVDPRFARNPFVTGDPHIRFYAGVPLVVPRGQAIGSLAVIDYVPRQLEAEKLEALQALARQVVAQLELRRLLAEEVQATKELARAALDASEDRRNAIVQSALDAIVGMDHAGRILEFNPAAERMFGRGRDAAIGQDMAELLVPPALRERHREGLRRYLQSGQAAILDRRLEMTALRADGSEFPVELTVTRAGRGEPPTFNAFLRDITDQKAAERELKLHIERFQIVERATNDAVWDWDIETGIVWRSDTYGRLFGHDVPRGNSRHEDWRALVHPDDLPATEQQLRQVLAGAGQFWDAEYRFRRRDGGYARVLDRGYVMRDSDGRAVRMIGAMIDISRLKEAEERFAQLAAHINEVFWLTDTGKREILYVSPAYERIWGRSLHSLREVASSWMSAVHPEDRARVELALPRQAEGDYDEEYRIVRGDGSVRWIRDRAFPIRDESGRVYRIAGVASDITQGKQAEEQLRQAQKLEAIGKLSAGVAHDFNNILTVIQGNGSMLMDVVPPDDQDLVREVVDAAERGAALTKQLLLFSRQQPLKLTPVNISAVAADMLKLLRRLVGARITLESSLHEPLPPVHADASVLQQVILNLVVNARDAMPDRGTIRLSTTARMVGEHEAAGQPNARPGLAVCLTVEDTGVGIPPETVPRIFEPFFTTKEVGKGTGLGLATVYGIVREHQGWIDVRSQVGQGTTFEVYFPAIIR